VVGCGLATFRGLATFGGGGVATFRIISSNDFTFLELATFKGSLLSKVCSSVVPK